jgi:hypothetical protein
VTTKRQVEKEIIFAISIIVVAVIALFVVLKYADDIDGVVTRKVVYDCRLAEISPDFPPDVRNECRKLRTNK